MRYRRQRKRMRPLELIGDVALDVVTAFWLARTLWRGWRLAR